MNGPVGPKHHPITEFREDSHLQSEFRYLAIGRIVKAHGIGGEVSMTVLTDFPERFAETDWVYLGNEFEATAYRLQSYRWHKQNILLQLVGITDRTQAEQLRGQFVQIPVEEAVALPDGQYYLYQLIGVQVVTTTGESLGTVTNILETGANDVFVVQNNQQEILLPDIPDVVRSIDLDKNEMTVQLIEGLI